MTSSNGLSKVADDIKGGVNATKATTLKAEELRDAAKVLQFKACGSDGALSTLKTKAQQLASAAGTLAKNEGGNASANAGTVIDKYKLLEDEYNGLGDEKDKVKSEFKTVEHIYDRMLNATKAKLLKAAASGILSDARTLYSNASLLATASKLQVPQKPDQADTHKDLRNLAEKLRDAVGATEHIPGLQKALSQLKSASEIDKSNLVEKAKEVINKYKDVAEKYKAVEEKAGEYRAALSAGEQTKYTEVTSTFTQLETNFDAGKCKFITLRFNIQNDPGVHDAGIRNKADELHSKAQTLKDTAEPQSNTELASTENTDLQQNKHPQDKLKDKATDLKVKAEKLHEKASALSGAVSELSALATALKDAASKPTGGQDGLKEKATALVTAINNGEAVDAKAGDVIDKFEDVRTKYDRLIADPNYESNKQNPAVIAVDTAYTDLNKHYDTILNVTKANLLKGQIGEQNAGPGDNGKILHRAVTLHGAANGLASADGLTAQEPPDQAELKAELKQLATNLAGAVGQDTVTDGLQKALSDLKGADESNDQIATRALAVMTKYNEVKEAYDKVTSKSEQYKAALKGEDGGDESIKYTAVTSAFEAFDNLYKYAICPDKYYITVIPSIICQWLNLLTFVIIGILGVYHQKVCKAGDDQEPGPSGCPEGAATPEIHINSVKLELTPGSGEVTHTITLNGGGNTNGNVSTSKAVSLATGGTGTDGTLTISIPGGQIKLTHLTIDSSKNTLTIQNNSSQVSVTKDGTKIKLNPTANLNTNTLTLEKDDTAGGQDTATIGGGSVELNYSTSATGSITIQGSAISDLRKYEPSLSPQYFEYPDFKKWSEYDAGNFYLRFSILMVIKICLAVTFIYSLHYRDSTLSGSIINQPKMSTFLSIIFYMCHEISLAVGFPGIASDDWVL